jgi:hypothetical protein
MPAAWPSIERGTGAAEVRLRNDVFDARTEALGALSETAKAQLVTGGDRKQLWRVRNHKHNVGLKLAMEWATKLGVSVDELWEQVA